MVKIQFKTSHLIRALIIAGIFAILSFSSLTFFENIEKFLYGIEMRLTLSPTMGAGKIAIVKIDENSLNKLGPWPWPRSRIAEMINILKDNGAKLVGLDQLYSKEESSQGLEDIKTLYSEITSSGAPGQEANVWIADRLKEIEGKLDNDSALVKAVKDSGNIIMPVSGNPEDYGSYEAIPGDSFLSRNILNFSDSGAIKKNLTKVKELTTPFP
jgi:CHASE2 domain-containing sensor protein